MSKITKTTMEIVEFGDEVLLKMKSISDKLSKDISGSSDKLDLLNSLNKILNKIDYDELKLMNETKKTNGFAKIFEAISSTREKISTKYTSISNELDSMYLSVKQWEYDLKNNNTALLELKAELVDLKSLLLELIANGNDILSKAVIDDVNDMEEIEKTNLLNQKIQDFEYSIGVCNQNIGNIAIILKTNFTIYKKLLSVYGTTLPTIQNQVNMFKILKDQNHMIESLKVLDIKRNELIEFGAKESIRLSKESVEQIGYTEKDFRILGDTIQLLKDGANEIMQLQQQKTLEIIKLTDKERENLNE